MHTLIAMINTVVLDRRHILTQKQQPTKKWLIWWVTNWNLRVAKIKLRVSSWK